MNSRHSRSASTGLVIAAFLAIVHVPSAYTQRTPESSASASSSTAANGSAAIIPFKIQVPNAVLTDLKQRLSQARFADEFSDAGWDYGTNLAYLRSLVNYWRDKYDWRAQEKRLNEFDQFKTKIDGIDIHFIHQRSKNPNAIPLLLLNGWPSSRTANNAG